MTPNPDTPPYPPWENSWYNDILADHPIRAKVNPYVNGLRWTLDGALESSLAIVDDQTDPQGSHQPYCQSSLADGFHHISKESLFEPKVSSIMVRVYELNELHGHWETDHHHAGPENLGSVYSDEHILISCHGESRPENKFELLVKASGAYLIVHDFVTAVHPWLISLRADIAGAMKELYGKYISIFVPMISLHLMFLKNNIKSWVAGVETARWVELNRRDKRAARLGFLRKQAEDTTT